MDHGFVIGDRQAATAATAATNLADEVNLCDSRRLTGNAGQPANSSDNILIAIHSFDNADAHTGRRLAGLCRSTTLNGFQCLALPFWQARPGPPASCLAGDLPTPPLADRGMRPIPH